MPDPTTPVAAPTDHDSGPPADDAPPAQDGSQLSRRRTAQDRASDVLGVGRNPLDPFFAPETVAVVGATEKEGSVGRTVLWNLISSPFGGTVFPINPKRPSILGVKAYPSLAAVPDEIDLAVVVTPAPSVPAVIDECAELGIRSVIVISAGFKEIGPEGVELERRILERARSSGMRVVGPNCLGVMSPVSGLNATFAQGIAKPGNVGFVSQSGALLTAVLDWSRGESVGFSAVVSLGSMLDVGWGDVITYLGNDPNTTSIVVYMETIGDARAFLSAAREVALTKPIIVIKPGRTAQAAKAAASHTGSLTGSDEVLDAAFARVGVLRVDAIEDLFYVAEVLAKQPRPSGRRLSILTNAGGPGVLATDALISGGGELTELSPETMERLDAILPGPWSHNNPIDILGDAGADRYAAALEIARPHRLAAGEGGVFGRAVAVDHPQPGQLVEGPAQMCGREHVAAGDGGAGVHLGGAPAPRNDNAIGIRCRQFGSAVAAAAVGDDQLAASAAQRR